MTDRARYLSTHRGAISRDGTIIWECPHEHLYAREATDCARAELARRKKEEANRGV